MGITLNNRKVNSEEIQMIFQISDTREHASSF